MYILFSSLGCRLGEGREGEVGVGAWLTCQGLGVSGVQGAEACCTCPASGAGPSSEVGPLEEKSFGS